MVGGRVWAYGSEIILLRERCVLDALRDRQFIAHGTSDSRPVKAAELTLPE